MNKTEIAEETNSSIIFLKYIIFLNLNIFILVQKLMFMYQEISINVVFVLSRCFLDLSVGVGAFVIGPSQTSSFFS